jgi:hypothetical protein
MKGCFATLLLCYFLPMHVFRYNEAVAQILSDFCNGPFCSLERMELLNKRSHIRIKYDIVREEASWSTFPFSIYSISI